MKKKESLERCYFEMRSLGDKRQLRKLSAFRMFEYHYICAWVCADIATYVTQCTERQLTETQSQTWKYEML